ncbi:MAG: hypothetical protein KF754_15865 [Planctomycetes bacterium]|nr:hypothetical protein [Planctomycetota bacterium]
MVATVAGLKAIDELREGDLVLARDEFTGHRGFRPVQETLKRHVAELVHLRYRKGNRAHGSAWRGAQESGADSDADPDESILVGTDEHPFWSIDRNEWVPMGKLRVGERLSLADGSFATVTSINFELSPRTTGRWNPPSAGSGQAGQPCNGTFGTEAGRSRRRCAVSPVGLEDPLQLQAQFVERVVVRGALYPCQAAALAHPVGQLLHDIPVLGRKLQVVALDEPGYLAAVFPAVGPEAVAVDRCRAASLARPKLVKVDPRKARADVQRIAQHEVVHVYAGAKVGKSLHHEAVVIKVQVLQEPACGELHRAQVQRPVHGKAQPAEVAVHGAVEDVGLDGQAAAGRQGGCARVGVVVVGVAKKRVSACYAGTEVVRRHADHDAPHGAVRVVVHIGGVAAHFALRVELDAPGNHQVGIDNLAESLGVCAPVVVAKAPGIVLCLGEVCHVDATSAIECAAALCAVGAGKHTVEHAHVPAQQCGFAVDIPQICAAGYLDSFDPALVEGFIGDVAVGPHRAFVVDKIAPACRCFHLAGRDVEQRCGCPAEVRVFNADGVGVGPVVDQPHPVLELGCKNVPVNKRAHRRQAEVDEVCAVLAVAAAALCAGIVVRQPELGCGGQGDFKLVAGGAKAQSAFAQRPEVILRHQCRRKQQRHEPKQCVPKHVVLRMILARHRPKMD